MIEKMRIRYGTVLVSWILFSSSVWAGYVWNTDGALDYAGTGGNWVEDARVSGKVVRDCDVRITDTTWSINGATDGLLTVENATVLFENRSSVRLGTSSDATLTIGVGGKVYWDTDDGEGYGYADVASNGHKATINILAGGSLEVQRNYFGNHNSLGSTSEVELNVAGGNLAYVGTRQLLRLGWHNPAEITVSHGGTLSSATSISIAESGDASQNNSSSLILLGESYLKAGKDFRFGTKATGVVTLSILANASGMGNIQASRYQQGRYGTVILGVDHAMSGLKQGTFTIVEGDILDGWQDKNRENELWNTRTVEGEVEAFLNPSRRQGGDNFTLTISDEWCYTDISEELSSNGWLQLEPRDSHYELELLLGGLTDVAAFADWYNESEWTGRAEVRDEKRIRLSGFSSDISIFAWDFSVYEQEEISLLSIGARNVPEPATLVMFLGMAGWLLGWQIKKKRGK